MQNRSKKLAIFDTDTGQEYRLDAQALADITGCTLRQGQRWIADNRIPGAAGRLVTLHATGRLLPAAWRFRIHQGALLCLDTRNTWSPADLRSEYLVRQQLAWLRRHVRKEKETAPVGAVGEKPGVYRLGGVESVAAEYLGPQVALDA